MVDKYSMRADLSHRLPRNAPRHPVQFVATLSDGVLGERTVNVRDLSRLGCGVTLRGELPAGAMVTLSLPAQAPIPSRVVWSDGEASGIKFVSPLDMCKRFDMLVDPNRGDLGRIRTGQTNDTSPMDAQNVESLRAAIAWSLDLAASTEQVPITVCLAEALDLAERLTRQSPN
ncbi:PilZ domain-containing protein [Sphingomonas sp. LB3N6]|uniref:PilZ domain-containing protein n=1 Tax=Sphingomonas fucosidasi TaxID=3096164 RepID=UPI003FA68CB7